MVLLFLAFASWGPQQAKGQEVQVITAEELQEAVSPPDAQGSALTAEVLSDQGHYQYIAVRRTASGEPEVHATWADVTVVREGSGTLIYGGRVTGGEETAPGETRGGRIVEGQERRLSAGDVVVVPAGLPHQLVLEAGETIVYTVVKVEQP